MAHVLVYNDDPMLCRMIGDVCEIRGHAVTSAHSPDDALMILRTSLHRIVAILEWQQMWQHPFQDFLALRAASPEWYAHHGYIGTCRLPLSDDEHAELTAAGVRILTSPYTAQDLVRAVAELAASGSA